MAPQLRRSVLTLLVSLGIGQVGGQTLSADSCAARADLPPHIRTTSCEVAEAVATGMARSATFRQLVDSIRERKGIVYVSGQYTVQPGTKRVLSGALQHRILKAGDFRLLFVTVAPGHKARHVTVLAHELQHVLEVLESPQTDGGLDELFERIGAKTGAWTFETLAATRVERNVGKELAVR